MKRILDFCLAAVGVVLLAPVMLAAALAIKLEGGGPVLFRQERVGRGFRPFRMYKFRTMVTGADKAGPPITVGEDPRITRVGRVLRRTKLDELPQLFNVLKGDMSFVGPRPELPRYTRMFEEDYRRILQVRPGITDIASITYRDESGQLAAEADPEARYVQAILPDKIRLARHYVEHASLAYDLRLICETVLVLAYPVRTLEGLLDRLGRRHQSLALFAQLVLAAVASVTALLLRFDGAPPARVRDLVLALLPALLVVRAFWLWALRLDRDMWRYVGLREAAGVLGAVTLGSASFRLLLPAMGVTGYPTSVLVLDWLLCTIALTGVRVVRRGHRELRNRSLTTRRVLVVGTGDAAERTLRGLRADPRHRYEVVGLVADDRTRVGLQIHSVPVVGTRDDLEAILRRRAPDEVLLARADDGGELKDLVRLCHGQGCAVRVFGERAADGAAAGRRPEVEKPEAEDLLFREPVAADFDKACAQYGGRRVLVTGAGGSIGSEICRQLAACRPERLVLFEKHEASLYHIERELRAKHPELVLDPVLGDVVDAGRVQEVFAATRPEIIFHAAAYKHVPMLECNPIEGYKTNFVGTRVLVEAADQAGVGTFVFISTDKAVEPISVLGASKRLAELAVQEMDSRSRTRFLAVRFGNVLESSGSVVPLFKEQIERGLPVTVTHPDATRWFMTVPEAVQLILEAGTMGRGGEVFVLDMGKPIRIVDLAHALIRQYGLKPGQDVPVVFIGLRPGERLFEKLFNDHELVWKTAHPRILVAAQRNGVRAPKREREIARLMNFFPTEGPEEFYVRGRALAATKEDACA